MANQTNKKIQGKWLAFGLGCLILVIAGFFGWRTVNRTSSSVDNTISTIALRNSYLEPVAGEFSQEYHQKMLLFPGTYYWTYMQDPTLQWVYNYEDSEESGSVLSIALRSSFNNPEALAKQPHCLPMIELRNRETAPKQHQNNPITIVLSSKNNTKAYVYSTKLNECSALYSNEDLLLARGYALELKLIY